MEQAHVTARLPKDLLNDVTKLAKALNRPRTWVIEEALRAYVAAEGEFLAAVDRGMADARAGRVTDHEAVMDDLDRLIDEPKAH